MNERILLVEDEPADAVLLRRALKEVELTAPIDVVRNGRSALDYLFGSGEYGEQPNASLPALVLLDLKLPKIGGFEVLAQMQASERLKRLPVIVLSSSAQSEDIARATKLGVHGYLVKPTQLSGYRDTATQIRRYWRLHVQQPKLRIADE